MAEITNAEAIGFVNDQIRPVAERLRDLEAILENMQGMWFGGGLSTYFSSADDTVEDGREGQGVSRLIRKPCVRTMVVGDE